MSVSTPRVVYILPGVALLLLSSLHEEGLGCSKNVFAVCGLEWLVNKGCNIDFKTVLKHVNEMG